MAKQTGIRIHLTVFAAVEELAGDKRTVLYRVAQEALTNASVMRRRFSPGERVTGGKSFQVERVLHAKKNKRDWACWACANAWR